MEGHPKLVSELQKAEEMSKVSTWTRNGPELVPGGAASLASSPVLPYSSWRGF